ncbi:MAG: tetratricopeptide repeat protein [Candidatus Riflebacteria bacterium]|nr:tetratricopeptide repeat protein [Candidatus Riflebacteria bacterium]
MDKKKLIFIGGMLFGGLIALVFLTIFSKGKHKPPVETVKTTPYREPVTAVKPRPSNVIARPAPPAATSGGGVSPELVREITEAREAAATHQKKMVEQGKIWLDKYLKDDSVSSYTKEVYRLRNNPFIQAGNLYYKQGDISKAKEEFQKALDDPNSTPSIKYSSYMFLMGIAKTQKNSEEYFMFAKAMGKLIAENDFTCFDQPKSKAFLTEITEKEIYFKARNSPEMQDKLAKYLIDYVGLNEFTKEQALKEVKIRIKRVERELLG